MADIFQKFLSGLRSQSSQVRLRTARDLRHYIESEYRDLSYAIYMKMVTDISSKIMELCNSSDSLDRMAGIIAMDELVELFIAERNDQIIIEFAHSLSKIFEKIPSADASTLRAASKALGHIVSTGGTSLIEFVEEYHMKPALVWLENDTFQVRRHAGVMILKELAINAPSIFYRHVDKYFDVIWSAFWDSKVVVRVSGSESLLACFALIQQRESNRKSLWYARTLDEVDRGILRNNSDATHGTLLIINELLRNTGDFMYPHFIRICKLVLSQKDHKNTVVRSAVINLFPRLAKFNSSGFQEYCYSTCMTHLLEVLHSASSTTKSDALLSIGKLALAIGSSLTRDQRTISGILSAIKLGLKDGRKKDFDHHREALACLRMLADAVGPALVRFDLESILNLLFQQDLNAHLVETLTTIVKRIPSQKSVIQVRLFERLSHLLSGNDPLSSSSNSISSRSRAKTSVTSGSLLSIFSSAISQSKTSMLDGAISPSAFLNSSSDGAPTITSQALALETLANFDFQGNRHIPVMQFVHETVVKFLDHDVAMIRKSAALTCCKLVLPPGEVAPTTGEIARPVSAVLERLLTVGIADTEASIRSKVLGSLDFRFDPLLGQPDNLRCLFIALNDEIFDIRETAMMTLGRLTLANPSTVMPSLRQTLVQLLAELEFSGDSRGKEEGAMLIGCLLRSASHLAKPYVLPILKVLMKNLREDNDSTRRNRSTVSVSRAVLASLGDLADVGAEQLLPFLHQLLPEIIDEMKDLSNNVQVLQAAIRTIGQLISSTGYVVRPYHEYPELLDGLCQAIQKSGDSNESLRIEAGRTLGIIGALDPYSLRLLRLQKQGRINGSGGSTTTAAMRELQRLQARNFEASDSMDSNAVALANTDRRTTSEMERNLFMMRSAMSSMMASTNKWESLVFGKNEESLLEAPFLIPRKRKEGQKDIQANNGNRGLGGILLVAPPEDLLPSFVGDSAHYFPTVAINALIRILLEPRNSVHYQGAILAIMYICKSLGKRIEPHLGQIIPAFLFTFEKVNPSLRKFLFEQLAGLIRIVEEKIQPHMDHMAFLAIIYGYWDEHLEEVLALVKELANSIGERFRVYMPDLIPQLLKVLRSERENQNRPRSLVVLKTIVSLGRLIDGYLHLIIPALVALIQSDADLNARKQALGSLGSLVKKLNVSVFASKIIHMLARVIATQQELVYLAMDCLSCMVYTMGEDYAIFVPVISQVIGRQQRTHDIFDRYDLLVSKILKYQPLPVASWATDPTKRSDIASDSKDTAQEEIKSLPINQNMLIKAWETTQRSTKEDWSEWMRAFSVELLRESPSPVLRACKELASVYQPLARELFNASFVSVWPHLSPPTQDNLIRALETAFQSAHLPSEILQTLLNLAEFMEHDNQSLPIDIRLLGSLAEKCHSFAKALHYKELEFNTNPTANGIQALISINSKLNQPEAARGILKYAQDHLRGVEVQASWHEKLLRWDDALKIYDKELEEDANNVEAIFGKIRCLYAIGEWRRLNDHVQDTWEKIYGHAPTAAGSSGSTGDHSSSITQQLELMEDKAIFLDVPPALKKELCSHAARVAFSLQHWELIPNYINADMDETESHLFKAVVNIRKMELEDALQEISECRKVMDPTLRSLVSESYTRAYLPSIVNLQVLAELEEIVRYLKLTVIPNASESHANTVRLDNKVEIGRHGSTTTMLVTSPNNTRSNMAIGGAFHDFERRQQFLRKLQQVWTKRMLGVERNIQVWQNLMLVRSLVLDPKEDIDIWLKYARLCRKNGHLNLAMSALWRVGAQPFIRSIQKDPLAPLSVNFNVPMGVTDSNTPDPRVAFSYLRHLWAENREDVALKQIIHFIEGLEQYANTPDGQVDEEARKLRVQVYIQLGEWQMSLLEPRKNTDGLFDQVLLCLETATCLDPSNHKAWHEWALMNFRALEATVKDQNDPNLVKRYAAPAINGFFRSISYGCKRYDVTKDVLRLLTLWFAQGHRSDVHNAMSEGFQEVSIDTWLDVIPQLIARIDSPNVKMNELLHELLSRIGFAHPQALIYPITVASKAVNVTRKSAAEGILAAVRRHSPVLVHEADMVSRELIRVAILWNELWYGALEEASKHFFNNRDPVAMLAELAPLHAQMEAIGQQEPPTLREVAFYQAFARDLRQAKAWTDVYEKTQCVDDLNQAWDIYYSVFSRIRKQLANLSTLELANVGPKLLSVHNLSLAVPGTYKAGAPIVRIKSFDQKVTVLTSKQRPRKVTINGSDGKSYPFLLKGHEDLRQDERVMQLFSVINTLLANDDDTSKRNLAIERYSVLPLSHTSGLIGWVPNCDTLHQLIRDYREARKIQLNVEHRLMVQMAPDYDKLPLMQKVEAFKYALGETTGQDLYRVLWLKSQDSEVWLDRRRNYTRSLAVMSMAGYILGLGDRHPSNLMLDRISGKIVHIDFGDCFEVAMERDKYPERVPFRLTRMLTQAMEVSGIEGNFRYTCEASMRVLRDNRDSLMAVLEAFVYDPLINWRLIKKDTVPSHAQPQSDRDAGTGAGTGDEDGKASDEAAVNKGRRGSTISNYRRRNSSADGMFSFTFESYNGAGAAVMRQMTRLPTTSESFAGMAHNSLEEAKLEYDTKNIGQSVIDLELPQLNEKALSVVDRVKKKLAGRDFDDGKKVLSVDAQVDRLIMQATSHENLCQLYYGWCPFW